MAIIQAAQKIGAYVEVIGKPRQSQHNSGQYRPVLFHRNDCTGDAQKVWKSMSIQDAEQFTKGQFIHLIPTRRNNKNTFDIEIPPRHEGPITATVTPIAQQAIAAPSVAPSPPTKPEAFIVGKTRKTDVAAYVAEMGDLYAHCYSVALAKLPAGVNDAQIQSATSSLFTAAQSRFNLA